MKLHLPKLLLTAVIAAVCCVQQANAATYYLNAAAGNDVDISTSFRDTSGGSTSVAWQKFCSAQSAYDGPHQLVIDQARAENSKVKIDFAPFCVTGINVTTGATNNHLVRYASDSNIVIGKSGDDAGAQSSSFAENFTLQHEGTGVVQLIGEQTWTITSGKTLTILGSVTNAGTTTINGGALAITKTINNQGALSVGNAFEISSFDGFALSDQHGVSYEGENGDTENGYRTISDAHYYLVKNNGGTHTGSATAANLVNGETSTVLTVVSDETGILVKSGQSTEKDTSWYYVNTSVNYGGENGITATGFALNGGELTLNASLDKTIVTSGIKGVANTNSTLNLAKGVTIGSNEITVESGATVNLKGSGTVAVAEKTTVGSNSVLPYTFVEGWTGTVDFTNCTADGFNFSDYGVTGSTIRLNGVTGWFKQHFTSNADVLLEGDGMQVTASSNSTNKFNGKVSGIGDFTYSGTVAPSYSYTVEFNNSTADWSGDIIVNGAANDSTAAVSNVELKFQGGGQVFKAEGNSTITNNRIASYTKEVDGETQTVTIGNVNVYVGKSGETSYMNAAIVNTNTGTLNVTATHDTVFNKALTNISNLSVNNGATATLKANSTTGAVTVNGTGALEFDGGKLTVSSSLTLDASAIKISESLTTTAATKTLLEVTGEGNALTVNDVGSWTGSGTYTIDGKQYTTSLSQTGNVLELTFSELLKLEAPVTGFVGLEGKMLTLSVEANLAKYSSVLITGISDDIMKQILGLEGLPEDGMVNITLKGTENSSFVGGVNGALEFQGNTGVYTGNVNVGSATEYNVAYIPEPATATLSLLALMGLAARRRRKA